MSNTMFGVDLCKCNEDLCEHEVVGEVIYCANCHGVIALVGKGSEE